MMVLIGTSVFSYKDWARPVYPEDLPKQERLAFCSTEFLTCELNFGAYHIPDARAPDRTAARVPGGFLFSIHAVQGTTHERDEAQATLASHVEQSMASLALLIDAGLNDHWQGQAVGTARQLRMLMEEDKAECPYLS